MIVQKKYEIIINQIIKKVNNSFTFKRPEFMKNYSSEEILFELKTIVKAKNDIELSKALGIQKQSLYQYKKKTTPDIQQKIISLLLDKLNELTK